LAIGDAAFSSGDIMRRLQRLESDLREFRGARRLESSTIGAGGMRVKGEGGIRLQNGGDLTVEDGGDILVDGGTFRSVGHDGAGVRIIGNGMDIIPPPEPTAVAGDGRLFAQNIDGGMWVELIPPRAIGRTGANRLILGGDTETAPGTFIAYTQGEAKVHGESGAILLTAGAATVQGDKDVYIRSTGGSAWVDGQSGNATLQGSADVFVRSTGGSAWLDGQAGGANVLASGQIVVDAGTNLFLDGANQVQINSGAKQVFIQHQTTTNTASCYLGTTGIVQRSTSARRFKLDIEDLDVDPGAVLQLRPRTWRDRHEVEEDPDTGHRVPGFVAEELVDIGLDIFVIRNDGEVESIAYDRLTAALIPLMQRQQQQIDALTARLDALEAAVSP
jgi:hypothetical protein